MSSSFDAMVCPVCKGALQPYETERTELVCPRCSLAFEVRNQIPVMIRERARALQTDELERLKTASLSMTHKGE